MDKFKKVLNITSKVLTWMLVVFTVFMMIFTVVTVLTVDKNERNVFGFKFYIVLSDSMSKSENNANDKVHFNAGDIVIIRNVKDPTALEAGDIIAFMSEENSNIEGTEISKFGKTITHRIRERVYDERTGEFQGYQTYGTHTGANDEVIVKPGNVLGKYAGKIPFAGTFFSFVKTVPGYIVCILVPFLLLILYNLGNVIKLFRKYKKEQTDAIAAERQQIEDERAENQRMMAELLELKAQLMKNNAEGASPEAEKPDNSGENEEIPEEKSEETSVSESENSDNN